jgi:uncharacterized BrkB/YihY/UPF0761 family membrane protein
MATAAQTVYMTVGNALRSVIGSLAVVLGMILWFFVLWFCFFYEFGRRRKLLAA